MLKILLRNNDNMVDKMTEAILNDILLDRLKSPFFKIVNAKNTPEIRLNKAKYKKKKRLHKIQNGKCFYCYDPVEILAATIDHYIPRSKGGSNNINNLVMACVRCNRKKGNKLNNRPLVRNIL